MIGPIRKHSALTGSEEKYCVLIGPGDEFNDGYIWINMQKGVCLASMTGVDRNLVEHQLTTEHYFK